MVRLDNSKCITALVLVLSVFQALSQTCQPGTIRSRNGCKNCPRNTFSSIANATECIPCPSRTFTRAGARALEKCKPCGPGKLFNETTGSCNKCPIDTYSNAMDTTECNACPFGKVSKVGARTRKDCRTCPVGTVVSRPGRPVFEPKCRSCPRGQSTFEENSGECSLCPVGTFKNVKKGECRPCPVGTFTDETGTLLCTKCPMGFFQDKTGATICKKCPENSTTRSEGASVCRPKCKPSSKGCNIVACLPGFGIDPETKECKECPPGTVSPALSTTSCVPCPVGDGTVNLARTRCVCEPGFRIAKNGECVKCESGFSNDDGRKCMCVLNKRISDDCECPPLTRQIDNMCVKCNPRFDLESESCIVCNNGEFFNKPLRRCEMCPANTFSSKNGVNCNPCPGGSTAMPGSGRCKCPKGAGLIRGSCEPCPPGSAQDRFDSLKCKPCQRGFFSEQSGARRCMRCPRRLQRPNRGATSCLPE